MIDVLKDLSVSTCVAYTTLESLFDKVPYIVAHAVYEASVEGEDAEIDLGFGELSVRFSDGEIRTKFVPSKKMSKLMSDAVTNGIDPMVSVLEESLRDKIENAYKALY